MLKLVVIAIAAELVLVLLIRYVEPRMAFFPAAGENATPLDIHLPYQVTTLTTADGERLRAWLMPNDNARAVVVYFHGNGGNLSVWLPTLAGMHREGFTVAAIDYRGYGASTGRPSERGLYRDADAALEWAWRIERSGAPIVYWGRSLGTAIAAYAAMKRRPDGLILEAGFKNARSLLRASPPLAFLSLFASYRFPTAEFASDARCSVLVMHGDADQVIAISNGRALFEALPEPKRYEVLRGTNHNDVAPPGSERYWSVIRAFIASLPPR
jgi:fermentation-respiration switch protein FrsA (DUF1100 family)